MKSEVHGRPVPRCEVCWDHHGLRIEATRLAAQSVDGGKTIRWKKICLPCSEGWNEGWDWDAPIYKIDTARVVTPA